MILPQKLMCIYFVSMLCGKIQKYCKKVDNTKKCIIRSYVSSVLYLRMCCVFFSLSHNTNELYHKLPSQATIECCKILVLWSVCYYLEASNLTYIHNCCIHIVFEKCSSSKRLYLILTSRGCTKFMFDLYFQFQSTPCRRYLW